MNIRYVLAAACSAVLVGCGGGDGVAEPAPLPTGLAKYIGNWRTSCDNHLIVTVGVAGVQDNVALPQYTHTYYANADCTGAIVATGRFGGGTSNPNAYDWRYRGTIVGSTARMPEGSVVAVDADLLQIGQIFSLMGFTGPGVTPITVGPSPGRQGYRIAYVRGLG